MASFESDALKENSHRLIPGGCHTYAKGDDQYPVQAPGFLVRGEGCHVWDPDGNEFTEYGMGLRAVTLGHAYPPVIEAAERAMRLGTNFTRPSPIEVECAEVMVDLIRGAEMAKFAKNGSDVTTAAVKLARACTGRDLVAVCEDQPFFSTDDWFIGTTPMNAGIPDSIQRLTMRFRYNDLESVRELFRHYPSDIACVLMEPATAVEPQDAFLQRVRELCHDHGALFILDEMITGFRWHLRGAQYYYDVEPDLSTFGKGLGNGFAVSCLVGKREYMELGGLSHDQDRVFLLSTTHGAETHALAAALATVAAYQEHDVVGHLWRQGLRLKNGIDRAIAEHHLVGLFEVLGVPPNLVYATRDATGRPSQAYRALFLQELIKRGVIAPSLVVSYAHTDADIDRTIAIVGEALEVYRKALDEGVERYLIGRPVQPVFRRRNALPLAMGS